MNKESLVFIFKHKRQQQQQQNKKKRKKTHNRLDVGKCQVQIVHCVINLFIENDSIFMPIISSHHFI